MSGSRTSRQELVFCHACQNEFYKENNSLTCPACHSDFTELIDPDFDPRADEEEHQFGSQNNWSNAPDPDEGDVDEYERIPGSSWRDRRPQPGYGQGGPQQTQQSYQNPFNHPVFSAVGSMIQNITGFQPNRYAAPQPPNQRSPGPEGYHDGPFRPSGSFPGSGHMGSNMPPPFPGFPSGRRSSVPSPGPGYGTRSFQHSFHTGNGGRGGIQISFSTNSGGGWRTTTTRGGDMNEFDDFNHMMQSFFQAGQFGGPPGPGQAHGPMLNPFSALLSQMLNPANAQHGDAVFSQEAFDRVMSQLMEQHVGGTAPGPASEAAIAALPRKKVTEDMLDENTKQAECSICMENVAVGEEVASLPCLHWFHHPCVEAWLKEHDTCPVCRAGIMPREGSGNAPRAPQEPPLHDEDPVLVARRQSGTREHPFVVPESPTEARRRPNPRRHSSDRSNASASRRQGEEGGGGITGRVRSFFGGSGGSSGANEPKGSGRGNSWR